MTGAEWEEIIVDTEKRWPGQWTPTQAVAYYTDLREFDATDVWSAWNILNDSGREFPPNGSMLRSRAIDERQASARRELWDRPQLVNPDGSVTWQTHAMKEYGRAVGLLEAVRIDHKQLQGCLSPNCDIHTERSQ